MFGVQDKPPTKGSPLFTAILLILSPWVVGAIGLLALFLSPSAVEMILLDENPIRFLDDWMGSRILSLILGAMVALIGLYLMAMSYFMWKQLGHWGYWTVIKDHTVKIQEEWEQRQNE